MVGSLFGCFLVRTVCLVLVFPLFGWTVSVWLDFLCGWIVLVWRVSCVAGVLGWLVFVVGCVMVCVLVIVILIGCVFLVGCCSWCAVSVCLGVSVLLGGCLCWVSSCGVGFLVLLV